jgi:hypothetical protein
MRGPTAGRTRGAARRTFLAAMALAPLLGCGAEAGPAQTRVPRLLPNATALANLANVEALERKTGRKSLLVAVSGRADRSGRLAGSDPWYYTFRDPGDRTGVYYQWRVDNAGSVTVEHLGSCGFGETPTGALGIDSDRAVALALAAGGASLLEARGVGEPRFGIYYSRGTVRMRLDVCYWAYALLDAGSGEVRETIFSCPQQQSRPCSGPGLN